MNTTSAFSISSKFGPSFSFNLNTATKAKLKYKTTDTASTSIKRANEYAAKSVRDNTPPELTIQTLQGPLAEIAQAADQNEETRAGIQEDTRMYRMSGEGISDQEVGGRIIPLLTQMRDSFINIEDKFEEMVGVTSLDEKDQCKP